MRMSRGVPVALVALALLVLPLAAIAQLATEPPTQAPSPPTVEPLTRLDIPLIGTVTAGGTGTFNGTFTLERFAEQNGQVAAVGMITGILTTSNGVAGSVLQGPVALPATVRQDTTAAVVSFGPSPPPSPLGTATTGLTLAQAPQQVCAPLHLEIGAVGLNVLGLTVATAPVVLDVSGEADTTGALRALVCQVPATAGNVSGLVTLLNQVLAALAV